MSKVSASIILTNLLTLSYINVSSGSKSKRTDSNYHKRSTKTEGIGGSQSNPTSLSPKSFGQQNFV